MTTSMVLIDSNASTDGDQFSHNCLSGQRFYHYFFQKSHLHADHLYPSSSQERISTNMVRNITPDQLWPLLASSYTLFQHSYLFLIVFANKENCVTSKQS